MNALIGCESPMLCQVMFLLGATLCLLAGPACAREGQPARQMRYVELSDKNAWSLASQGDYHCRYDRRDLYCMFHRWTTAAEGDHATLGTTVTIPSDWKPPFGLQFYCSDDYVVVPSQFTSDSWVATHAYPGHRFKQVLVNGKVVWEADVADPEREGTYAVGLTDHVTAGEPFELAIRVIDLVGTAVKLDGEFFHPGGFDPKTDPRAFATHVYWGDILLCERFDAANLQPSRETPSMKLLEKRIEQGLVPRGPVVRAKGPATVTVEAPTGLVAGYPLSCGVPLPQGAVSHADQLRLAGPDGRDHAAQFDPLSKWPDGSLRWALATLPVPEGTTPGQRWTLSWRNERRRVPAGVLAEREGDDLIIGNGAIVVRLPAAGPHAVSAVTSRSGGLLAGPMTVRLVADEDWGTTAYSAVWDKRVITAKGPRQITVEMRGKLAAPVGVLGRCIVRLQVTEGSPLVRAWLRVFNDTDRRLKVSELLLAQDVQNGASRGHVATLEAPNGWYAVDGKNSTVFAAVRWAAEMPTKSLSRKGLQLQIKLFTATEKTPYFQPRSGEARRHELLLGYFERIPNTTTCETLAALCQRPPRLWNSEYACQTGALGYADMHDAERFPRLTENRLKGYGEVTRANAGHTHYDMRHFGDRRYGDNAWCNNYYDASRGFIAEYLMTGNPNCFDRAEEEVLHQLDVDVCHWAKDPTFLGGLWSYSGDDHSNAGYVWNALMRCAAGWSYYYRLTGDPDAKDALRGGAEYFLRDGHNVRMGSVRDHGGTLTALVWAYDELGDQRYLEAAKETMRDVQSRIARRRGAYVEIHGNYSYPTTVPWMTCETTDALYRLWQLSGDVEAAATALALAESMMCEQGTWDVPGEISGYSGNPWFTLGSGYNIILAPVMGYGYEMTGDPEFLLWARACFERTLDDNSVDAMTNNYWLTPNLLYMLNRYADVKTSAPPLPAVRVTPTILKEEWEKVGR